MAECFICASEVQETFSHQDVQKCSRCVEEFKAGKIGLTKESRDEKDEENSGFANYENSLV